MKKIFSITYLVAICLFAILWVGCQKEREPYVLRVGGKELMVQSKDLGAGTCITAQDMCRNSTEAGFTDWRLPTSDELMILYNNRKSIGGFLMRPYWACDETYNSYGFRITYSYIDFKNGSTGRCEEETLGMVRAVRTITE